MLSPNFAAADGRQGGESEAQRLRQERQEHRAEHGPGRRAEAAEDDDGERLDRKDEREHVDIDEAKLQRHQRAGDADEERRDHERHQLVAHKVDAHDARGDVVVADRHPGAADPAALQVQRDEHRRQRDRQRQIVERRALLHVVAGDAGALNEDAVGAVRDRLRVQDHMRDDERKGERGDGEIDALQPQRRHADDEARQRGGEAAGRQAQPHRPMVVRQQQAVGVGADGEEAGLAERDQAGLPRQQVERDSADDGDQRADHERQRVDAEQRGRGEQRGDQRQGPAPDDAAVAERDPLRRPFLEMSGPHLTPARCLWRRTGRTAAPSARRR